MSIEGTGRKPELAHGSRQARPRRIDWLRFLPYMGIHLTCFAVIWVGVSWVAVAVAAALYVIRMFAITGFYHRYFSHRTFKTHRFTQFLFAVLGNSSVQRGPLWWAAHHRHHHRFSDQPEDIHSPKQSGFWWSHMFWIFAPKAEVTNMNAVRDLAKFPELRFIDRFDVLVPVLLAVGCFGLGAAIDAIWPGAGTSGWQMLIWGFFISTVVLYHGTYTINSLSHVFGGRRFETEDTSRNNFWLALLTLGEGWHNNHHHYQYSTRQGFYWWEIDITFYTLKVLSWLGLIWDLRPVPEAVLARGRG
ncbi:MAG: acyl-CoA desaturase [Planctomycetota bacterium]